YPFLAVCIVLMMLSLIGMPPFGGFFGKLYMFMEALSQPGDQVSRLTLIWLVALGLFNSVVSAFYYVRVLKAMFLRGPTSGTLKPASSAIVLPILVGTFVVVATGLNPRPLVEFAKDAAVPMLSDGGSTAARTASTPPRVVPNAPSPTPAPSKTVATAAEVAARVE
ncbi:MAG: NADH-quinone oxidoreductase subunit N, partial [Planctomycetota bacterium]|nr:NADH-quinone oxidoreductase subunit N [Planctomycetota bacterium]